MQPGKVIMRALYRSATSRASLCLSGAAALTALLMQSGALGLMAIGGYLLAVSVDLGRPGRWRAAVQEVRRDPPDLPSLACLHDSQARELLLRIEKARTERALVVRNLPATAQAGADATVERACAMEESAGRLLLVLERVSQYLAGDPIGPAREELVRLDRAAQNAAPKARVEYDNARRALSERLSALQYTDGCRALLLAKLEALVGGLEAVSPGLMALELRQATAAVLEDNPPLHELLEELHTLEEAAATAGQPMQA
jgi:hypothetical protein